MNLLDIWIPRLALGYGLIWYLVRNLTLYFGPKESWHWTNYWTNYLRHHDRRLHRWSMICLVVGGLWTLQNLLFS